MLCFAVAGWYSWWLFCGLLLSGVFIMLAQMRWWFYDLGRFEFYVGMVVYCGWLGGAYDFR